MTAGDGLSRLVEVMHALRSGCPWDARQTHLSLVPFLIEETLEVVDAIESGTDDDLAEELGDVLLQVVFHAEIAAEQGRFTLDDVADRVATKLVGRHPYVFGDADVPEDLMRAWEQRKRDEKSRSSSLAGIPTRMSSLARASKVVARARHHGHRIEPWLARSGLGAELLALVARAQTDDEDPDQALRKALCELETRIAAAEAGDRPSV